MNIVEYKLEDILIRAEEGATLSAQDITFLLSLKDRKHLRRVFQSSRKLRQRHFGDRIFLYGFVYISTYCRNDCGFCFYRRSNPESTRYRKTRQEIMVAADRLTESNVHLIDLTMGEDPIFYSERERGLEKLIDLVASVKNKTGLPIMVSPGVMTEYQLMKIAEAGATWYACYQETHNRRLFAKLRPNQNYEERLNAKFAAHHQGLLIEEGVLCGVDETVSDLVHSLKIMQRLNADQVRAMTFVPQPGTPMSEMVCPDSYRETLMIAVMRLIFPKILIPASLDVNGLEGLKCRLDAGANVITSIVPPGAGLAGVASPSKGIEDGSRTVKVVLKTLEACGLKEASQEEYNRWVEIRKDQMDKSNCRKPGAGYKKYMQA
ncbi:MAG: methylornithine synthase PylB [Deltaproteobacteria bacterium]